VTQNEIRLMAESIISKIERRGGNDCLRPKIDGDAIRVDYRTDCDRMGDVENSEGGFMIGFPLADRCAVVDVMKEILSSPRTT